MSLGGKGLLHGSSGMRAIGVMEVGLFICGLGTGTKVLNQVGWGLSLS